MSSILVVRFGSMGDVILASAATKALAEQRDDLCVDFLVKQEYKDLLDALGGADNVLPFRSGETISELRERIRPLEFTTVIDLQTSPRSSALLAGHPNVLRWNAERWLRRRWVSFRWTRPQPVRPAWLRFVDAVKPLGVKEGLVTPPRFDPEFLDASAADQYLAAWPGGPITFLAPGAHWPTKRWPEERFLEVGRRIVAAGGRVLIGGDASDRTALPALDRWAQGESAARWYQGSLTELAALLQRCERAITNDTGLMHLAAAAGVKVTAVFGSTHPALGFAPAGEGHRVLCAELSCQPCTLHGRERCPLGHHDCVRNIGVDTVLED